MGWSMVANDSANCVGADIGSGVMKIRVRLTPLVTIAAEIGSFLNIHLYTHFGIPVSTSHSTVVPIWGIGIYQGIKAINLKVEKEIILTWATIPLIAGIISYVMIKIFCIFL
ncbi:MAG: inorganic phosphate transporter [Candidatus Omnitrophica bacterium]|nr:inorganic phosphate transporter [Candidatus Omnitrophota bacterium]